jgi:hypothetical protein
MRGISQAMILRWRLPLHRKPCFSGVLSAKAAACSAVCRRSCGSDIHSRMIARRARFSGLMARLSSRADSSGGMYNAGPARHRLPRHPWGQLASVLKFATFYLSDGNASVFLPPLRPGASHVVCLGAVPVGLVAQCGPPSVRHGRARLHNRDGNHVCYVRELMMHRRSPGSPMYRPRNKNSRWNPPRRCKCKI